MKNEKQKRLLNAVKMWCMYHGFNETEKRKSSAELVFNNKEKTIGFILCDEENANSFSIETECDLTYAVISDPEKRSAVQGKIPDTWGILCYGNPFGLGCLYQVLREAK